MMMVLNCGRVERAMTRRLQKVTTMTYSLGVYIPLKEAVLAEGALAVSALPVFAVKKYMTPDMTYSYDRQCDRAGVILTHALIAVFPNLPGEDQTLPMYCRGGDYVSDNKTRLKQALLAKNLLPEGYQRLPKGNAYPLPAPQAARMAGLGVIGRHNLLITKERGSLVTIVAILTNFPLTGVLNEGGYCENCGACVKACPTGAIGGETYFVKEKCISFMVQENKTGKGCDLCQLACPKNKNYL